MVKSQRSIELVRKYVMENFVAVGMCADIAIHEKQVDGKKVLHRNPHAHILLTTRAFKADGTWAAKEKKTYALDEQGQRIPIIDPATGLQKLCKRNEKMWKRVTVLANDWNDQSNAEKWRQSWADMCNRYLAPEKQIDHRSYERQGVEQLPTIHEGYVARQMEQRGEVSERMERNKSAITSKTKLEGVAKHNLRKYKSSDYSANNIVILQGTKNLVRDVKEVYHQEFDAALKDYNERQKREDRKIADYFEHVANKEQDMAVEIIIQLGDREYWKENEFNKIYMERIYGCLLDELKRLFPNFIVANAVVHMDEDSPHMHVVGVPVAYGYTRGLSKQVSKRWVFTPETLSELLQGKLRAYANRMVDIWLQDEIKEKSKGRNHDLTVAEYKVAQETEKYERLREEYVNTEKEVEALKEEVMYTKKAAEILKEQAQLVYEVIRYDSEDSLRARCIDAIVENQQLKEENAKLRESLRKAYDFMEKMVIDGRNMLERFMESLTKATERVMDEWRIRRR